MGISLLQQLSHPDQPHVVISPYSLSSALLMTWNGAAGRTRAAIGETLGLDANSKVNAYLNAWLTPPTFWLLALLAVCGAVHRPRRRRVR